MKNQELVTLFLENDYLISPDIIETIQKNIDQDFFIKIKEKIQSEDKPIIINKDIFNSILKTSQKLDINWTEFEKSRVEFEKEKNKNIYLTFLDILNYDISKEKKEKIDQIMKEVSEPEKKIIITKPKPVDSNVMVLKSYNKEPIKRHIKDFVSHFRLRYNSIKSILQNRSELQGVTSIARLSQKREGEKASIIGMVREISTTKNKNLLLQIEDLTGTISALITTSKKELSEKAKNIVLDETIALIGNLGKKIIFTNEILFPDIPINKELKKANEEVYAAFISDLHIGSKLFLKKDFENFINWLNYKSPDNLEIAKKIKYLFILGDTVDGIGIYPGQENELEIKDIKEQYNLLYDYLAKIRSDLKIILCPGNHDAVRLSEPQPPLDKKFTKKIYELPNITLVSNPALVNIHSTGTFSGFNVLMYHGASFHYYIDHIESLRLNNATDKPSLIAKILLQKRHLAPSHTSNLYIPDIERDDLIIDKIPDVLVTGDMHKSDISSYNNTILISCSCFQSKTGFQEKIGNNPDPSKVPLLNLKTREVKMLFFGENE